MTGNAKQFPLEHPPLRQTDMKKILLIVGIVLFAYCASAEPPAFNALIASGYVGVVSSYSDNFNRANQEPLTDGIDASTTPANTWADTPGFDTVPRIYNQQARTGTTYTTEASAYSLRATWNSNQWASGTVGLFTAEGGPAVRLATSGTTRWGYGLFCPNSTTVRVLKWTGGAGVLVTGSTQTVATMNAASVLRISVIGSSIYAYVDGVLVTGYPVTDTSVTTGSPGWILRSSSAIFDNWSAGNN